MSNSAWDSKKCWFCLTKHPEYVLEFGEDGSKNPSFACCRWCTRLLQSVTGDGFAVSNKIVQKKKKKRAEIMRATEEHAALIGEIQEFLNAPS